MGGTGWSYFVPYQEDIEKALQELRQKKFEAGGYFLVEYDKESADYILLELKDSIENKKQTIEAYKQALHSLEEELKIKELEFEKRAAWTGQPPKNIDELIWINDTEGTHSIIDIQHIADEAAFGVITKLQEKELLALFDTVRPTKEMVKAVAKADPGRVSRSCRNWQGTYLVVYKEDIPEEIFFAGHSGD